MFQRTVAPGIEMRQFAMGDAEALYASVERNREYLRVWMPWVDSTRSADDVRQFILRAIAQSEADQGPQAGIWIDGTLSGSIGCHPIDWTNRSCSIGYWIEEARQGRGVITQCSIRLMDYLFEEALLHRVEIRCGTGNARSCAIPQRLGFTREGVIRDGEWVNDRWLDLVVWGILEDEWRRGAVGRSRFREDA